MRKILSIFLAAGFAALLLAACKQDPVPGGDPVERPWHFRLATRSGETPPDQVATFRASMLHNGTGALMSDGSYSGYYKTNGWLYPCRTDADGNALDETGAAIPWDAAGWFDQTDKDGRYALRAPANQGYTLVLSSPALRMDKYLPEGKDDVAGNYVWGFPLERENHVAISEAIEDRNFQYDYLSESPSATDYCYIFPVTNPLLERRATITVKVACGALSEADLHAVHFQNIMSSGYWVPKAHTYGNIVMDGGSAAPLDDYYTENTYPTLGDPSLTIAGNKLVVPDTADDIHLVRRTDTSVAFSDADEWIKATNTGKVVTAIREFSLLPLNYALLDGDQYRYEELMPRIIVYAGERGNLRSTVTLAANVEPMKHYTVYIYLSSAAVKAVLTVADWDAYPTVDGSLEGPVELPASSSLVVADWNENPVNPIEDGTISN